MRKMFAVGLATVMAVGLCAYGSQKAPETTTVPVMAAATTTTASKEEKEETMEARALSGAAGGEGYMVVLCNYSIGNSWRARMEQEFMTEAGRLKTEGMVSECYITNSNKDVNKQISDIQDLTTKKIDTIVIMAALPAAFASVVKEATETGIRMISFDSVAETDEQVATVGTDGKESGRIEAEQLADKLDGRGRIVVSNDTVGTVIDSLRWGGAEEVFRQHPDIEILGSANVSWNYAQNKAAMEFMLSAYPEIDGVWSQGGAMTQGATDVFIAANRDLVPMISEGNNGIIRAWIENENKGLFCIAPSNPTYTSAETLRVVIRALDGEDIPGNVVMDIETATEENVDQYYRPDMLDSFWVLTEPDDATLQKLYEQSVHLRDNRQADEYWPALHIKTMSALEREGGQRWLRRF